MPTITLFPPELWFEIFGYLGYEDLHNLLRVSEHFCDLLAPADDDDEPTHRKESDYLLFQDRPAVEKHNLEKAYKKGIKLHPLLKRSGLAIKHLDHMDKNRYPPVAIFAKANSSENFKSLASKLIGYFSDPDIICAAHQMENATSPAVEGGLLVYYVFNENMDENKWYLMRGYKTNGVGLYQVLAPATLNLFEGWADHLRRCPFWFLFEEEMKMLKKSFAKLESSELVQKAKCPNGCLHYNISSHSRGVIRAQSFMGVWQAAMWINEHLAEMKDYIDKCERWGRKRFGIEDNANLGLDKLFI